MDKSPLPPCYTDYLVAVCCDIRNGDSPPAGVETMTAAIGWWYTHPALLGAMCIEDALTWVHDGTLMGVEHLHAMLDGRGASPYPCTMDQLLIGMRLAACMPEREMVAEILGGVLDELNPPA